LQKHPLKVAIEEIRKAFEAGKNAYDFDNHLGWITNQTIDEYLNGNGLI